jgi:diguanylate cyclase (GGDEF)-like protein/PAS domain S-box-containing protein
MATLESGDLGWLAHAAIDDMEQGVSFMDRSGRIIFSNAAATRILGLTADEINGRTTTDPRWRAVDECGESLAADAFPAAVCLRTGTRVGRFLMGVHRPDGELRWVRVDSRPLRDPDGAQVGVVNVFDDVTAERVATRDLAVAEERLTMARRAGRVGLWEWDRGTGAIWHDDYFSEVTGGLVVADPDQWLAAVHPADRAHVVRCLIRVREGLPTELTYRVVTPEGTERWLIAHADVISHDAEGFAEHVAGSVVDVTDIQQTSAQLRLLLDSMTDGYFTLTSDWRFGFVNRRAGTMLQRAPEELIGLDVWEEFPGAVDQGFGEQYRRAMDGEAVEFEAYYSGLDAWYEVRAHPLDAGIAVYFRDVSERRAADTERQRLLARATEAQARLAHAALHDTLTGLPNRLAFDEWVSDPARSSRRDQSGVLYIDLDRFKLVNDTFGHVEGDALLVEAARRLEACVRPGDFVGRLGGDEFVVAMRSTTRDDALAMADRIVDAFRAPFTVDGRTLMATASIGVAVADSTAHAPDLLRDADAALYQAKDSGRNRAAAFSASLRASAWSRLATETDLRDALQAQAIRPHFQPIYDLRGRSLAGAEALARWDHPTRGAVSPAEFMPIAEETGLVVELGWHMLDRAADALQELRRPMDHPEACLWINVAARQLDEPGFAGALTTWAADRGVAYDIGLEITESAMARDTDGARSALEELASQGFRIAIDDFGTGFSSLSRLNQFPAHMLKIDRSFISEVHTTSGASIVRAIVDLAHATGAQACAEGVETAAQLDALHLLGVDKASGYHLCPPLPLEEFGPAASAGCDRLRPREEARPAAGPVDAGADGP